MVTAAYPSPPVIWSRPRAGSVWHARRSFAEASALCRYTPKTGWVGQREVEPDAQPYPAGKGCTACRARAQDLLEASRSAGGSDATAQR